MNNSTACTDTPKRRSTAQKQIILETLVDLGSHVSAGAIFRELQKTHPHIGRATVFRVLSDMAKDGTLLRVPVNGSDDRFDITTAPHYHIFCRNCGKVDDVTLDFDPDLCAHIRDASGFSVEEEQIAFSGLCRKCQTPPSETDDTI